MAYQSLGIGGAANDGTGDTLRAASDKINDNFLEIYTLIGDASSLSTGISATASVVTLTAPSIATSIAPSAADGATLGTASLEFSDLYLADGGIIYLGDDQDINITHVEDTGITTNGTFQATTITATTAVVPDASDGAALGTTALEWSDLYLADGAVIGFGDDQEVTLTHVVDTGLLLSSTDQLQFGDSGTYIHQSADGVLDLVSDTEIELTATTIDVNGNLDVSGTLTQTGIATFAARPVFSANVTIQNDGQIGSAGDADAIAISSGGVVTMTQIPVFSAGLNVSGGTIAGTLSTAAQTNITSLGTLSALTVDDVAVNGKVITMTGDTSDTVVFTAGAAGTLSIVTTDAAGAAGNIQITADGTVDIDSAGVLTLDSGAAINIEPAAGSAILLDGTISIDAGVVTGATSITSTAFVGDITGDVTGTADAATAVTVADESSDTTCFPLFATAATGDLPPKSGTNLTFNSSSGLLTATLLAGDLTGDVTGTADTATVATTVTITDNESTNESNALIFTAGGDVDGGNLGLESDGTLTYNPSTGIVTATGFAGALTGNVTGNASGTAATVTGAAQTNITSVGTLTALQVDNININLNTISSTAGTDLLITPLSGQQIVLDGTIIIDAGVVTGATSITSTAFVGDITGDVTGTSDVATAVTVADESSDTTCFPLFATAVSGNLPPKSGTNLTFNSSSGLLTATSLAGTVATATQNSITTATALVSVGALDSGSITSGFTSIDVGAGAITTTGVTTTGSLVGGSVATEHGAGAVATSFAPITRRYTQNGVIITKIHFDLTGLVANGDTANDVIGLSAGGAAYIGRHVVSSNGIVFKAELACIELPVAATGTVTTDIDIATNSADDIAYDAAGGTAKLFNAGVMVAGQELSNITPAITANDYFYLVEADTTANDSVFNAGQYILTLYGHAIS